MDQEHPIPQQISSYQFRLVGDMTLKQFFQVAAGVLISLVLYSSNLAPYIKWPLIVLSFLIGLAFAFFPLEDRPLSLWVMLFIKAIYSPTIYNWRKQDTPTQYFQPEPSPQPVTTVQAGTQVANDKQVIPPTAEPNEELNRFEQKEKEFMSKVSEHFESTAKTAPADTQAPPVLEVVVPEKIVPIVEQSEKIAPITPTSDAPTSSVGNDISRAVGQKSGSTKLAEFSLEASPPIPPSKPNLVVGQVIDSSGKILDNTILEIKDSEGRSVRALKSNKLGHFMIVTPLANGKYEITAEKEGFIFDPITFEARGEIIPSIFVKAKSSEISEGVNRETQLV